MYGERPGLAKTIHETRYGELLGLVIVGPQATELVNAGVVGISAEATIDTIGRLDHGASDPGRGGQGGGARRARAADPPAAAAPASEGRRPVSGSIDASRFLIPTLKDDPADAEAISHKLLVRGGFVRQVGSGLYTYLPLGWRVLRNAMQIIREEMDTIGLEMLMPVLQPAELWQATDRYEHRRAVQDGGLRATSGTCSRSRTRSASPSTPRATSARYRELPQIWYHQQTKERDEPRPRGGILRTREFIMKDSYSFDRDRAGLEESLRRAPRRLRPHLRALRPRGLAWSRPTSA